MDYIDSQVGIATSPRGLSGLSGAAIAAMEPDVVRSMLQGLGAVPNLVMTGPGFKRDPGDRDGPIFTPELAPQYGQVWSKPLSPEGQANVELFVSQNPQWRDVLKKAQGMDKLAKVSAINAEVIYRKAVAYARANGMPIPRKPDKNTLMKAGIGIALIGLLAAAPLIVPAIAAAAPTALTSSSIASTVGTAAVKAVVPLALKAVVPGASAAPAAAVAPVASMATVATVVAAPTDNTSLATLYRDVFLWERTYQNAVAQRAGQRLPWPDVQASIPAFNPGQKHDENHYRSKIEMYRGKIAAMQSTPAAPSVTYAPQPAAFVPAAPAYTPAPTTYEDFSTFAAPATPSQGGYHWEGYRDGGDFVDAAPDVFTPQASPSSDSVYPGETWNPDLPTYGGGDGYFDYGYNGMSGLGFDFGDLFSNIVQTVAQKGAEVAVPLVQKLIPGAAAPVVAPLLQPIATALPVLSPVVAAVASQAKPADADQVWHDTFVLERTYYNEVNRRAGKSPMYPDPEANIPPMNPSTAYDWSHFRSKIAMYRAKLDELSRMPVAQKAAIGGAGVLLVAGLALFALSRRRKSK